MNEETTQSQRVRMWWSHLPAARKCEIMSTYTDDPETDPNEASRLFLETLTDEQRNQIYNRQQ